MFEKICSPIRSVAAAAFLLTVSPAFAQQAPPPKLEVISYHDLFDMGSNTLAWSKMAGKTVAITGAHFFSIADNKFAGKEWWVITLTSSAGYGYLMCDIAPASLDAASAFKKGDLVTVGGKLAASPHVPNPGFTPFDGPCLVVAPKSR